MNDVDQTAEALLLVEDLIFCYPGAAVKALDGLTISVPRGQVFGLLGPNGGAGKTTAISIMCTLLRPNRGQLTCVGLML